MQYKIAYGIDTSKLNNRNLIDKFIVATMNNDQEALEKIIASLIEQPEGNPTQQNKPFAHLQGGSK